jgi:hypothetical protein
MRPEITTIVLAILAIALAIVAYLEDPGLPLDRRPQRPLDAGLQFVVVRVIPSLAFPILAGWLVHVFYEE